jgi:hypothetical protein
VAELLGPFGEFDIQTRNAFSSGATASPVEGFLKSFPRTESLLSTGGLFPSFWLALSSCLQVVERDLIMGGVVEVASPPLVHLTRVGPAFGALHVDELTTFLLDVICIFYLDVVWEVHTHCYVHVFIEWIKEVVVVVV